MAPGRTSPRRSSSAPRRPARHQAVDASNFAPMTRGRHVRLFRPRRPAPVACATCCCGFCVCASRCHEDYPTQTRTRPWHHLHGRAPRFGATPVATQIRLGGQDLLRRGPRKIASALAARVGRRRRSAATRRSWSAAPTTARLATSSRSSHSSTRSSRTRPETRCGDRRSTPSAAEAARRAEVVRDGDGEGVLVDDAVPPAARHEDDVAGPAVRLDEVRMRFRLGVEARVHLCGINRSRGWQSYTHLSRKREHVPLLEWTINPGR